MTQKSKQCQSCGHDFLMQAGDFEFYKKVDIPAPKYCPECRMRHRLAFRNERSMYRRTCGADGHGESILSIFSEESGVRVYCNKYWHSDAWDPISYGKEFDFKKPFFEQFRELMLKVPFWARLEHGECLGCEYANWVVDAKNVYLSYSVLRSENVIYSSFIDDSRDIANSSYIGKSELLHECFDTQNSSSSRFLVNSRSCVDSAFCFDLVNCNHCFMCSNLRNSSYCIRNVQYKKEDYEKIMSGVALGSYSEEKKLIEEFNEIRRLAVHKYAHIVNAHDCTGDQIYNSRNVKDSYIITNCENVSHVGRGIDLKDSMDCFGAAGELLYECSSTGFQNVMCKWHMLGSASNNHRVMYCLLCGGASDLFGCVGIKGKKFCILNKQYSESEYKGLLPKVIEHMMSMPYKASNGALHEYGDSFPIEFSPFDYRWTVAEEFWPSSSDEIKKDGFVIFEESRPEYNPTLKANDIPDNMQDVENEITKEVIECEDMGLSRFTCTRAFRVTARELEWLRKMGVPLPRKCPNCRYSYRMRFRNPLKLWSRSCMCSKTTHTHSNGICPNIFETTYNPDRSEQVLCESCYQLEIS